MWWLFGVFIVLVALYFSYTVAAPLVAVATLAIAGVVVLIEFAAATARVFSGAAPIEHLSIEPPPPGSDSARDPAYRSYFFGPVFRDYALAMQMATRRGWERAFIGSPATSPAEPNSRHRDSVAQRIYDTWSTLGSSLPRELNFIKVIMSGPMVGGLVGVGAGAAAAAVVAALISVVFGLLLGLTLLGTVIFAVVLRLLEQVLLQIRGITLECGNCHRHVGAPVYSCPHCQEAGNSALHRKLIPGPQGVFFHVCRCGNPLPTLLLRKKWKLQAYCQHDDCNKPLPVKGLTAPTIHVPVVAGRAAGKTVFMMAAVASLETRAQSSSGPSSFEFADPQAKKDYHTRREALQKAAFGGIGATLPEVSVQAFNIYLGPEGSAQRRLLYLYDAAGERYESSDGIATFRFLGHTAGVILIVDPFSFSAVRRFVKSDLLAGLRHSEADADEVFGRFAQNLRENLGVRITQKLNVPVAVVLTKCDGLLAAPEVAHPYDELGDAASDLDKRAARSAAVRSWLESVAGQRSFVATLENSFGRCGYFAVSALDAFRLRARASSRTRVTIRNDDTADPLVWLLGKREEK